ncbi:MAG: hypothetical protein IJM59_05150 [Proteobacteria bacterium]|nr:hypothetical protein [Pseudomonadota bacterium]
MRKQILLVLGICAAAIYGCEDSSSSASHEEDACKTMTCKGDEHCDAGKCLCGDKECGQDESCVKDKCEKVSVPPEEDPCKDKTCSEGEHCDAGKCLCGDKECGDDESCVENKCTKKSDPPDDACKDKTCAEGEHCDAGKCLCGDEECSDYETCEDGSCRSPSENTDPGCTPSCGDDEVCEDGACKPNVPEIKCNPACNSESQYCDNGVCKTVPGLCICKVGETCSDSGDCKCGESRCKEEEYCEDNTCKPKDRCAGIECPTGQTCVDGSCKRVTLSPSSMDVMLSSVSGKLVATSPDGSKLDWTITVGENTSNEEIPEDEDGLLMKCRKSDKTLSRKLSECIIKKDNTETVQFVGYARHLKTVKIAVKNSKGDTDDATLTLKPYFDTDGFIKTDDMGYRNGYCPGEKLTSDKSKMGQNAFYDKDLDNKTWNLGGKTEFGENEYGDQIFDDKETAVIDKETAVIDKETAVIDSDMHLKYVHPKMFKDKDGKFYGTRASVVAAARFLILQFPYDIPYTSNGITHHEKMLSHYLFTQDGLGDVTKVDIHGLNLTSNVYNSSTNHESSHIIKTGVIPWGAPYNTSEYHYNGLECSGFVTWAFRNGYLGLGDWNTYIFAKKHELDDKKKCEIDGKIERFYKCEEIVNNVGAEDINYNDIANQNNRLLLAYKKMEPLDEGDFIPINYSDLEDKEKDLNDIFKDAKAGDLLVRNNCSKLSDNKYDCDNYMYGHVGMIIGIKRGSKKEVTSVYVGEAMNWSGNQLTKIESTADLKHNNIWMCQKSCVTFLVKMDKVYNYYSAKGDKDKIKNSDCPDKDEPTGNCYAYTENYNDEFNKALETRQWGKEQIGQ